MKLLSMTIYKWDAKAPIELAAFYELSSVSFFYRNTLKENIRFHSRTFASTTAMGRRQSIEEENLGKCYVWVHPQGVAATVLADQEYPMQVAFRMISELLRHFLEENAGKWEDATKDLNLAWANGEEMFRRFQNPAEADKVLKIQKELDDVKDVVTTTMGKLIQRGIDLDELARKSSDLSSSSNQFRRAAQKNNQCCKLM